MLAKLKLELESDGDISVYNSSNLQGVIMEQINGGYADILHESKLNPYSQHLEIGEKIEWIVCTFTTEAYNEIIVPLLSEKFQEFEMKNKGLAIKILNKELKQIPKKQLFDKFNNEDANRSITIEFITPTSFKRNGSYVIYPDLELIYKSLMNKYNSISNEMNIYDEDTLEEILSKSRIIKYNLHTCFMPLEKVKINAFKGRITIKISGSETLSRYVRLLFEFGEFCGIGIKTAIGMGAIKLLEERRNVRDRRTD